MSRIGIKPVKIPEGVEFSIQDRTVKVKGTKGELSYDLPLLINLKNKDKTVFVERKGDSKNARALHGLSRALIANMIEGVSKGFDRKLEINGVGYKARIEGDGLVLSLGFSHPVKVKKPEQIDFKIEKNIIIISGIDKQLVGETAATIRKLRPPEPYKGKGIRYEDEHVRRKVGKAIGGEEGTESS